MLTIPLSILALSAVMHQTPADIQDPGQKKERTVFQTGNTYSDRVNLRADVAIVYGFDPDMPNRVKAWRDRGYIVHLMTGVAWGEYQDYYFGRWDGKNHEDEAQTRKNGEKIGHGKDVYYMSPGKDYGKYLASGVRRALEVGVEAVHLEEPEFWDFGGYGEGFKREWQDYYHEAWQDPESSPDARWRAAKLMYYLYRRALQQVFDSIQVYNKEHGTHVRCYVPTHSLLNYSHWGIVSPESSLARLKGCDGYIAQVWTGTSRTPNIYQGVKKERTFETAFLEYGSSQNLVRATGRGVWYLADPIEDDPNHDWNDYRTNYQSTLVASLLQPDVHQYEVMPWPNRIFYDKYPSAENKNVRVGIPKAYETELQVVINSLKDMDQKAVKWEGGSHGVGLLISDSLMFQRGGPESSDPDMGHVYGLAMPFVKRGMPIQPVQLENVGLPKFFDGLKLLLMTYEGMKPLTPDVHEAIAKWVKGGGTLAFIDADADPFLKAREWWNTDGMSYHSPREHLFEKLGLARTPSEEVSKVGKGKVIFLKRSPTEISHDPQGSKWLIDRLRADAPDFGWKESGSFVLRRGPYVVAAGLDESDAPPQALAGNYVDLFDSELRPQTTLSIAPGSRHFLVDLNKFKGSVVASAGYVHHTSSNGQGWSGTIEGQADTNAILLLRAPKAPSSVMVDGKTVTPQYDARLHLLWLRFPNQARPQKVEVRF